MKQLHHIHPWIALTLALVLLTVCAAAAADSAFSFRGGITWNTTIDGMMAAEGLQEGDGSYNREDRGDYHFFYLKAQHVYYVFSGDRLVIAYVRLSGGYAAEEERLGAQYGAPAGVTADTVSALINQSLPGSTTPDDFERLATWRLSDGTLAALFTVGGENYLAYFRE